MNKTALITGASHGIGRAIALELAKKEYDLYINGRTDTAALKEVRENCLAVSDRITVQVCQGDAGDENVVAEIADRISQEKDSVDVLVNCAGTSHVGLLQDMSFEQWKTLINVNLDSVFLTCKYVIPLMLRNSCGEGRILNISSVWGSHGASCECAYSASKGGVNAFTKALARELAPSHIAVNALSPGFVDTRMNGHLSEEERSDLAEEIPAGRFATPEDVARQAALILNSDVYMTGQIITFDGGWYL
ncbi:MAG: SDR family oxidoreductase [Lachnospiraceae bacterium]|nr:SDR family oxidoreductase [Lachnospiraceae bacterium]